MANPLIVDYHDACIYSRDLSLLDSPTEWLNDACINYQMTRLQQRFNSNAGVNSFSKPRLYGIHFLDPSVVSYFMHSLDDEEEDDHSEFHGIFRNWGFEARVPTVRVLLIPINDNNGDGHMICGGGNHWSLLLVLVSITHQNEDEGNQNLYNHHDEWYFHFDSSTGYNRSAARAVARRVNKILEIGFDVDDEDKSNLHRSQFAGVMECKSPQQRNGYDCGVHAIVTAEALATELLSHGAENETKSASRNEDAGTNPVLKWTQLPNTGSQLQDHFETIVHDHVAQFENTCAMARMKRREIAKDIRQTATAFSQKRSG